MITSLGPTSSCCPATPDPTHQFHTIPRFPMSVTASTLLVIMLHHCSSNESYPYWAPTLCWMDNGSVALCMLLNPESKNVRWWWHKGLGLCQGCPSAWQSQDLDPGVSQALHLTIALYCLLNIRSLLLLFSEKYPISSTMLIIYPQSDLFPYNNLSEYFSISDSINTI